MNSRESRIRALAYQRVLSYLDQEPDLEITPGIATSTLVVCAQVIDAIDALPVPGCDCASCGGRGTWEGSEGKRYPCGACERTGRAER